MKFEYDINKSKLNYIKHNIDFEVAKKLWDDENLIEIPAKTEDEERYIVIGKIDNKYWTGVITYRDDKTRIISVRRSRKNEEELYESY